MSMKKAKQICKVQGINLKREVKVYCPYCESKSMILKIDHNSAYCIDCKKTTTIDEVLRLAEEDESEDKIDIKDLMNNHTGVCP